ASVPIVAKLERAEMVANLPGILPRVDAAMGGRGDLGLEVPLEEVPRIQKEVIQEAPLPRVPVTIAAPILGSMLAHLRPARAPGLVACTLSGFSARLMCAERPDVPIIAVTPRVEVQRRLGLSWGGSSRLCRKVETTDEMIDEAEATVLGDGTVCAGDTVVIISGAPMWVTGTTNLLKLHRIGERR